MRRFGDQAANPIRRGELMKKRAALIQEVDGIVANSYQYLLGWDGPSLCRASDL